jgi:hypothetical protein
MTYFSGKVDEYWYDGRVEVSIDVQTHLDHFPSEVIGVVLETLDLGGADAGAVLAHDDAEGGEDLLTHHRRHGGMVEET